ncbi:zinc-dependent alcohol dehydrogenase [Flaviflagellibacter deserti]|uniref:Dehydrogenase n=1 Tax=Flaviflagellibacter deserti TaxID=2267266 RepID=A0ABV9YWU8_9HYPH
MTFVRATALWMTGPGTVELRSAEVPTPEADEVLVRVLYSGVSRGTESLVFAGRVPASEHQRMRAPFQEGEFGFPVKYGYSSVGVVENGPAELIGRVIFCLHPHQDRCIVPAAAVVPIPENVPEGRAVLAANMETALNVIWDADVSAGDSVAVVGCGVVGALAAHLAKREGAEVTIVDVNTDRERIASALDCAFAVPEEAPRDCDIVVHTSATAAGLATALDCGAFEGTIIEASWYGDQLVPVPLGGAFHSRRLKLISSQVGHLPPEKRAEWTHRRRMELALSLLADERLDVLISGETDFANAATDYPARLGDPNTLCHRFRYF